MAVTHMTLVMLSALAAAGSSFSVLNVSRDVRVAGMFAASIMWALVSVSSFQVSSQAFSGPEPVYPLVFVGAALSISVGALSLYHLSKLLGEQTGATESSGLI